MGQSSAMQRVLGDRVDAILQDFVQRRGGRVARDVLIDLGQRTSCYAFVLIDRFGVLGIDLQSWPGAAITGSNVLPKWIARVPGEKPANIPNPLKAGRDRAQALNDMLEISGRRLPPGYTSDLVVFGGADLRGVQLGAAESLKLVDVGDLAAALDGRHDFATNPGSLEATEVNDIASLLYAVNRFDDPQAQARHFGVIGKRKGLLDFFRRPDTSLSASDSAVGVAPVAVRLSGDRYPEPVSATTRRKTSPVTWVALLVVIACAGWLFGMGGLSTAQHAFSNFIMSIGSGEVSIAPTPVQPSLSSPQQAMAAHAEQMLMEGAPDVYQMVTNPGAPDYAQSGGYDEFTWHYIDPVGQPKTITMTLDSSGVLRGVRQE